MQRLLFYGVAGLVVRMFNLVTSLSVLMVVMIFDNSLDDVKPGDWEYTKPKLNVIKHLRMWGKNIIRRKQFYTSKFIRFILAVLHWHGVLLTLLPLLFLGRLPRKH